VRIQSGPSHAAKGGVLPPPTIMAIATALPGLLAATAAPEMTWLPLNVAVVDNDRGASPNSYRARALGAGAQQVPPVTPWMYTRWQLLPGTCCFERERARWHGNPVLGRWLGLTPEQPALCLRGFPRRPRAAPSRVSDPPGLGRRQGAQGAARGAVREKRYNLPHPGVQYTRPSGTIFFLLLNHPLLKSLVVGASAGLSDTVRE